MTLKGQSGTVEPIRDKQDIELVRRHLANRNDSRGLALFTWGINSNLRASDILGLRVEQVSGLNPNDTLEIRETKTKKRKALKVNRAIISSTRTYLAETPMRTSGPLFVGQRGAMTVPTLSRQVKRWCKAAGLKGNFAAHTLRKTWTYHHYKRGAPLPILMTALNHSSQRMTLRYIGLEEPEVMDLYDMEL